MAIFSPKYIITNSITNNLLEIERIKSEITNLPVSRKLLHSLRQTAKLSTIHYSTQIEGNRLSEIEVEQVLIENKIIPNRQRDEKEIKGYYVALDYLECIKNKKILEESDIKTLHALVEGGGNKKIKPTEYREGQNVIKDSISGSIVYMPPEAFDVANLMKELVNWINADDDIPAPIKAGMAHYQFVTIHPYFDGNGRCARLLTTLLLHKKGYDLSGIYSLEEYYAKDLQGYYEALTIGESHNYYMGRAECDITKWIEYFVNGMNIAFKSVYKKAQQFKNEKDDTKILRELDIKQRQILELFQTQKFITANDIAEFFNFSQRSGRNLALTWVNENFLIAIGEGKKRKYQLTKEIENSISD
ncbi:MAG: Fic family protein [Candidatus Gastranaerophilales bacterium]